MYVQSKQQFSLFLNNLMRIQACLDKYFEYSLQCYAVEYKIKDFFHPLYKCFDKST